MSWLTVFEVKLSDQMWGVAPSCCSQLQRVKFKLDYPQGCVSQHTGNPVFLFLDEMIAFEQLDYLKWFSWVKWKLSKNYWLADIGQRHIAEVLFSPAWRIWTLGGQYFRDGTWSRISPTIAFRGCHGVFMGWVYPLRALVLEIQSPSWWCEEVVGLNGGDV